jgi:hypothetical protein
LYEIVKKKSAEVRLVVPQQTNSIMECVPFHLLVLELVEVDGRPRLDLWGHEIRTGSEGFFKWRAGIGWESPNVNEDALDIGQRLLKRHNTRGTVATRRSSTWFSK